MPHTHRPFASGVLPGALLLAVALGGGTAAAAPTPGVTCGSTLTTDVTLTADLHCPSGNGILLGSNVTLDLGGHSLVGSGSGVGVQTAFLSQGGNTVRNGTIENWDAGVVFQETPPDGTPYTLSDVDLVHAPVRHSLGLTTLYVTRVDAVDSTIVGEYSSHLAITDSTLTRSDVEVLFAAIATITDSVLLQTTVSAYQAGVTIDSSRLDGKGISALGSVSESIITIADSDVKNYARPIGGFWGGATITGSTFTDMAGGVLGDVSSGFAPDGPSEIVGNTFTRSGVVLRGNVPMIVENNTFKHNTIGVEFTLPAPWADVPPPTADGSRAVGNILTKNSGTGILTELPGLQVGDNTAIRNGGYGIYAPGAIDLGGNVAYGNALGQCVGVVCAPR